jgi:protein ImuA
MSFAVDQSRLDALLQHPALWRGRGAAPQAGYSTGFDALDAVLPGGGWPKHGLVEILTASSGSGELPAWQTQGARLDRLLMVRAPDPLWALEQTLLSGACAIGFAWPSEVGMTALRRLALAAERGASLGVLIRPLRAATQYSAAVLRMALTRTATHLRLQLLKGRGLSPCVVELPLP